MSISYEEALATLEGMFGEQWSREQLDTVLRHQQGHMENTVDLILSHGSRAPAVLIDKLNSGQDPTAHTIDADAELARQLATGNRGVPGSNTAGGGSSSSSSSTLPAAAAAAQSSVSRTGHRGTPTQLPPDFLRIGTAPTTTSTDQLQSDEALARMLQDNLFSEEISRNPDFAHLARGSNNTRGTAARSGRSSTTNRISMARPPSSSQPAPDLDIIKSLGELGNSARRRLQVLAAQFHAKTRPNHQQGGTAAASANTSTTAERRGLLNDDTMDDDVALEFATRKDD